MYAGLSSESKRQFGQAMGKATYLRIPVLVECNTFTSDALKSVNSQTR